MLCSKGITDMMEPSALAQNKCLIGNHIRIVLMKGQNVMLIMGNFPVMEVFPEGHLQSCFCSRLLCYKSYTG